jgi:membrane-associated phospholipid phosphatase
MLLLQATHPTSRAVRFIDLVAASVLALLLDQPIALFAFSTPEHLRTALATYVPNLEKYGTIFLLAFVIALCFRLRNRYRENAERAMFVLGSGALAALVADLMKGVFGRTGPSTFITEGAYGFDFFNLTPGFYSFPSGHAAVAAAIAGSLSVLSPSSGVIVWHVAAAVVAMRVITGDYFLSDTLCGFAVGLAASWCLQTIFQQLGLGPSSCIKNIDNSALNHKHQP